MLRTHDTWERLVTAVLRKQQLWELCHAPSRSPSILSEASDSGSSSHLSSPVPTSFDFPGIVSSSRHRHQREDDALEELQKAPPKLVLLSDFVPSLDVVDAFLASAELIGRGTFGEVYTAVMKNGAKFVVKRLKSLTVSETDFKRTMEIVGNVRHDNVVALRAYYSSRNERLMLHDYYSNGSVFALLHGRKGKDLAHIDWETRLRIAIGAARGIAVIHSQNGGRLVHGNIKSSNIFLNPQNTGCVSDLGVTSLMETTFRPTARCCAPEVKNSEDVSQASDVYGFGILLLELLTRKSPVRVPGALAAYDLVMLISSVESMNSFSQVLDADLLEDPTIMKQMAELMQIGIKCVAKSREKRPKMPEVVKMLEDLIAMNIGIGVSSGRKLVFLDGNPTFDLTYMLDSSAKHLGRGIFCSSHKVSLDNGEILVAKKSRYMSVTFNEFQQHMEVIGRMRHENIAKLKAYCFSSDRVLFVYDYYNQGSLSDLLHGRIDNIKIPFAWETRMRIAVGAAKGIAHTHLQDDGKLVHGNIKSSNILLNRQGCGLVADAGLAKIMKPIGVSDMRNQGYFAPEVDDSMHASQASDVYSFGVVLLELVSGRPAPLCMVGGRVISLVDWIQLIDWMKYCRRDDWKARLLDSELLKYGHGEDALVLLQIALDCVTVAPDRRPTMAQVVKMLEELTGMEPSIGTRSEDTQEQLSTELRLERALQDMLSALKQ